MKPCCRSPCCRSGLPQPPVNARPQYPCKCVRACLQVSLFRVHKHFITPEAHFYRQKYKLGDNAVFLTLYANGARARLLRCAVHAVHVRIGSSCRVAQWPGITL